MSSLMKKAIANEFINLCFEKPIKKITIQDIIQSAGISKQTFYNHFKDKDDVMNYIFDIEANNPKFLELTQENYVAYISLFFQKMTMNQSYYKIISNYDTQNNFSKNQYETVRNFYFKYVLNKHGQEKLTTPVINAIYFFSSGYVDLIERWINNDMRETPEELAEILLSCMPNALKELL